MKLRLEKVTAGYGSRPVLSDVSFDCPAGTVTALIGPNGAGKSTILKTICGQLPPIAGRVLIDGEDLTAMAPRDLARKMAVALTDRVRPELMTCRDVAALGRYPYTGRSGILSAADEEKVEEAIRLVSAEDFADADFDSVSDGQRQRILLARALAQDPEILLLDEPTSYLDIRYKLRLLELVRKLADRGVAVVMSLHEIDLAQKAADRICAVDGAGQGGIRVGTPEEIFREDRIRELYGIDRGSYDPLFGSIEMAPPAGDRPEVFVISSGASGIPVYRTLQKRGIPFAAGVLAPGEADWHLARHLAWRTAESIEEARDLLAVCKYAAVAGDEEDLGPDSRRLLEEARRLGKAPAGVV